MEIENFDYDWKQNRSRIPEMTYNFKRIERYNHAKPPRFLVRFWTLFVSFLIGLVLMSVLFFNNLGMVKLGNINTQASIQNQNKRYLRRKTCIWISIRWISYFKRV